MLSTLEAPTLKAAVPIGAPVESRMTVCGARGGATSDGRLATEPMVPQKG